MWKNSIKIKDYAGTDVTNYYFCYKKLENLYEKKSQLDRHIFNVLEEQIQLLLSSFADRQSVLRYLEKGSLSNNEYIQLLIEIDESKKEFIKAKKKFNEFRLGRILNEFGLERIEHTYTKDQLLSLLISSSLEETLALVDVIDDDALTLLEGSLKTRDVIIDKSGKFIPKTRNGEKIIRILHNYILEKFVFEESETNTKANKKKLALLISSGDLLELLKTVGCLEDFLSLKNQALKGNVALTLEGKISCLNEEGQEFTNKLYEELKKRAGKKYGFIVVKNLHKGKNTLMDSISQKYKPEKFRNSRKILMENIHHPIILENEKVKIINNHESLVQQNKIYTDLMKDVDQLFENFSKDLAEIQVNILQKTESLYDKKAILKILFELDKMMKNYQSLISHVDKLTPPSQIKLKEAITGERARLLNLQIEEEITNEIDRLLKIRFRNPNYPARNLLINNKNTEKLMKIRQFQEGVSEYLLNILLAEDDNLSNVELLRVLLRDMFELLDESIFIKSDIVIAAEEILREARLSESREKVFSVIDSNFSKEEGSKMKQNFGIVRKNLDESLVKHKEKIKDLRDISLLGDVHEGLDLEGVVQRMEETNKKQYEVLKELTLEFGRHHRKIDEIETDSIEMIKQLLLSKIRSKIT